MERQFLPVGESFGNHFGAQLAPSGLINLRKVRNGCSRIPFFFDSGETSKKHRFLDLSKPSGSSSRCSGSTVLTCAPGDVKPTKKTSKMYGKQALGPPKLPKSIAGTRQKIKESKKTVKGSKKRVQSRMGQAPSRVLCSQDPGYM